MADNSRKPPLPSRNSESPRYRDMDTRWGTTKWKTILALVLMYTAVIFNWQWIFGLVFLIWVIPDIRRGATYFIEPIEKSTNPGIYWTIIITWLLGASFSISTAFIDYAQYGIMG